jgi:hypothetical protein
VDAKILRIHMKVRDTFTAQVIDADGAVIGGQEDVYVPGFMPGQHYGDYLLLDINLETGMVENWKAPTAQQIQGFLKGGQDD